MQLLDDGRNGDLVYALRGLQMLLPQCEAFRRIKERLDCVGGSTSSKAKVAPPPLLDDGCKSKRGDIDCAELLAVFKEVHRAYLARHLSLGSGNSNKRTPKELPFDLNAFPKTSSRKEVSSAKSKPSKS